jgi:P-type Cu+ transporter
MPRNKKIRIKASSEGTLACDCCNVSTDALAEQQDAEELEIGQELNNKRKFNNDKLLIAIGLVLTIPIVVIDIMFASHHSVVINFIMFALASPVQFILGKPFYVKFSRSVSKGKAFTTNTLVVLSTSVAYGYSVLSLLQGSNVQFFEASSAVLTIFTFGEWMERRVQQTTTESIRKLFALTPKTAVVVRNDGTEEIINVNTIRLGDILIARPGEQIATDGVIIHGQSSVDESMITGESIPEDKKIGDKVIGGTINKNGYIQFRTTGVGSHTILASIIDMVKRARMSKAPIQRIADRGVRYFIPIVLCIGIVSSLYWLIIANQSIPFAITVFATVLVVSCPCALGIATPMVISLGIDRAARNGVLIKGGQYLEKLSSVDTVLFDKTGTITTGKLEVTDVIQNEGYTEFEVLQLSASTEIKSEHPIAQAIVRKASHLSIPMLNISEFNSISGHGIVSSYLNKRIFVGSPRVNHINNVPIPPILQSKIAELESDAKTVVAVFVQDDIAGLIAVADTLRENAQHVIYEIQHKMKKDVILMSGDNEKTVNAIAKQAGIIKVLSEVRPEAKALEIKKLQDQGRKVVMVGDGINDAPALTQADVGIAMGSGTDIAMSSGHVILMKADLHQILYALDVSKYSMKKIKQNLAMSFAYNFVTISLAAGVLYNITNSLVLTPSLAALGWVLSDAAVFGNSVLVRRYTRAA